VSLVGYTKKRKPSLRPFKEIYIFMKLEIVQRQVAETAFGYPENGEGSLAAITYLALGLTGESGEVADKVKKIYRDQDSVLGSTEREAILLELGDVFWYLTRLSVELGSSLEEVAELNYRKLAKRRLENKIGGSGDNR
jgi:NTP pyrophosphatase (non-canonical NTP hydrolase)